MHDSLSILSTVSFFQKGIIDYSLIIISFKLYITFQFGIKNLLENNWFQMTVTPYFNPKRITLAVINIIILSLERLKI